MSATAVEKRDLIHDRFLLLWVSPSAQLQLRRGHLLALSQPGMGLWGVLRARVFFAMSALRNLRNFGTHLHAGEIIG